MESRDPPLRQRRRVGRVLLIAGVVAVIGLLVPLPLSGRSASAVGNLFHAPLFGGLTVLVLWAWNTLRPVSARLSWLGRAVTTLVGLAVVGGMMETLQAITLRSASIHDAIANTMGATAGAALFLGWQFSTTGRRSVLPIVAALGVTAALVWAASVDAVKTLVDVRRVTTGFPILATFESEAELHRWYFRDCWRTRSDSAVTQGDWSMRVRYGIADYPGLTLVELQPDWSSMKTLELDVSVDPRAADPVVRLVVKVTDRHHTEDHLDSFHRVYEIPRGESRSIQIDRQSLVDGPADRPLDLTSIRYLDLLLDQPTTPTVLYFDHVRIVR